MKKVFVSIITVVIAFCAVAQQDFRDPSLSIDERAQLLLNQLTLEEKLGMMEHQNPAVERLGIPAYSWWNEALHGVARNGYATVYPMPIALAATFDDKAVQEMFGMVADEARMKYYRAQQAGQYGDYTGLTFFTPNINIFRDPRWGRGMETYGEDPYLTGRMGAACVNGLCRAQRTRGRSPFVRCHCQRPCILDHLSACVQVRCGSFGREYGDVRLQPSERCAVLYQRESVGADSPRPMGL